MTANPLDDSDETRQQQIRQRAYHLWEADGRPNGGEAEFWERARELIGMEESAGAAELPNPATLPGADPDRTPPGRVSRSIVGSRRTHTDAGTRKPQNRVTSDVVVPATSARRLFRSAQEGARPESEAERPSAVLRSF